jgi:hypothetical protein
MQQIIFGLSSEMNISPIDNLKRQEQFISDIDFQTDWAKEKFATKRRHRLAETVAFLDILE